MNNGLVPEELRELIWRRNLTPAEAARWRAWLAAHPEAQGDGEVEAALTEALGSLPDAPMPSNFTARVLQAAQLEDARKHRAASAWGTLLRFGWLTRAAAVAVVLGIALISFEHVQDMRKQNELAQRLSTIGVVPDPPHPEALEDFKAIRQLSTPDDQLLSLMQQ
jgi:anti-sigma factor RsiW